MLVCVDTGVELSTLNVQVVMAVHLWLRAEKKPNERRTHLTPEKCKELVKAGESVFFHFFSMDNFGLWYLMFETRG